jgi:hypothetical protein
MIEYIDDMSPFYLTNRSYCERIAEGLEKRGAEATGFCNAYGYEIKASIAQDGQTYRFHFEKHQSTQNGVIVPVNALDYAGVSIAVDSLQKRHRVRFGRSAFYRMLTSAEFRKKLRAPYYGFINNASGVAGIELFELLHKRGASQFTLKNGAALLKMHAPLQDVEVLFKTVQQVVGRFI